MKLVKVNLLKHIESFSPRRVANMQKKMLKSGIWEKPICIEKNHFLVLDGQHRFEIAKMLRLKYIPCELFDYYEKGLETWSLRKDCVVSKELVIKKALDGDIYPYKTAKHRFPRQIEKCMITLKKLESYSKYDHDMISCK